VETYGEFIPQVTSWIEDRLGVNRITVEVEWVGERPSSLASAPLAIPLVRTEHNPMDGGSRGTSTYYFEGVDGDPTEEAVYDLEGAFSQEPIAGHPRIGELLKKYRGALEEGEIVWDTWAPKGTQGKKGLNAGSGKATNEVNLLYGVQSYYAFGAVWTETRVRRVSNIPASVLSKVGTIVDPPGPVPKIPKRNWLEASPQAALRGNVLQIKRRWILSGFGGWIPDIYDGSDIAGGE
jgi:hypothetical protein